MFSYRAEFGGAMAIAKAKLSTICFLKIHVAGNIFGLKVKYLPDNWLSNVSG